MLDNLGGFVMLSQETTRYAGPRTPRGRTYLGRFRDFVPEHLLDAIREGCKTLEHEYRPRDPGGLTFQRVMDLHVFRIDIRTGLAGQAWLKEGAIHLHAVLTEAKTSEFLAELDRVLLHELAHVLDYWFFKKAGHGRTWKRCNAALGRPNEDRCHTMGVLPGKKRTMPLKFAHYNCSCGATWKRKVNFNECVGRSRARVERHEDCPVNGVFQFSKQVIEEPAASLVPGGLRGEH